MPTGLRQRVNAQGEWDPFHSTQMHPTFAALARQQYRAAAYGLRSTWSCGRFLALHDIEACLSRDCRKSGFWDFDSFRVVLPWAVLSPQRGHLGYRAYDDRLPSKRRAEHEFHRREGSETQDSYCTRMFSLRQVCTVV